MLLLVLAIELELGISKGRQDLINVLVVKAHVFFSLQQSLKVVQVLLVLRVGRLFAHILQLFSLLGDDRLKILDDL
jgi:hypothetical protein